MPTDSKNKQLSQQEMRLPQRERLQEWPIQLNKINKEVLKEVGLMVSCRLPCNNRWPLRHPTVSMVEELLSDKFLRVRDVCNLGKLLVCLADKLEGEVCKETIIIPFPSQR